MNKNLIIFHLESLSNAIFQNNINLFPNLKKFSKEACAYNNYYSTCTSTFMVMSDLIYGDETIFEKSNDYSTLNGKEDKEKNLLEELHTEGYYSEIIAPPFLTESEKQRYRDIFGKIDTYFFADTYDRFREEIEKVVEKGPFALYITEFISHIAYSEYRGECGGWNDNWKKGYALLDSLLGFLLQTLKNASIMDRTVIVAYGDHGDDFYSHKFNGGFTHGIEPYSNMIRTPLFIFGGEERSERNEMISTISLRSLIKSLVYENNQSVETAYVYARNLYTAQKKGKNGLNKAFSISNGEYLLLASCKGIELYNILIDPGNEFNILDLFKFEREKIKPIRNVNLIGGSHFGYITGESFYKEIQEVYEELSERLKKYVLSMYEEIGDRNRACEIKLSGINYISKIRYYKMIENYINLICTKLGGFHKK